MANIDTAYVYNPLSYNQQDRNPINNRQGLKPSFQYKKKKTIWLNSAFATSYVQGEAPNTNKYYEFSFDVPDFHLYNQTELSVISYTINENASKPMYIKVKNLLYDTKSTYCSDKEAFPMLFACHTGATGMTFNEKISLTLVPQTITNITLKVSSSFTSRDEPFTIAANGTGHFIICLLFQDADLVMDDTVSAYK
jgi:hypothetical protein